MNSKAAGTYSYKGLYNLLTAVTFLRMGMGPVGIIFFFKHVPNYCSGSGL